VVYGDRAAALARELTKLHETVQRGRLSELLAAVGQTTPKGEYVVLIAGAGAPSPLRELEGVETES